MAQERGTAVRTIVDAVLDAVAEGRLPAGTKLGEDRLSSFFALSRTVVREALKELSFLGVVDIFPNRGAFVVFPSAEEGRDLYAARRLIEAGLLTEFVPHCTANDIRILRAHVAQQRAARDAGERREYLRLMGDFHLVLARAAGNPVLVELLTGLVRRTSLMTALYDDPHPSCALDEHEQLIDAMIAGDTQRCIAIMTHHLTINERRLAVPGTDPAAIDLAAALTRPGETARAG